MGFYVYLIIKIEYVHDNMSKNEKLKSVVPWKNKLMNYKMWEPKLHIVKFNTLFRLNHKIPEKGILILLEKKNWQSSNYWHGVTQLHKMGT